ncbi:hypothetical protein BO71DRAFT_410155, partial [Aspergillus ellipticus CBS 707.79]
MSSSLRSSARLLRGTTTTTTTTTTTAAAPSLTSAAQPVSPHLHHLHRQPRLRLHRPYSSSPPPPPASPYSRSNFKILPFLTIIAIGTGSYVLLVKSRTGVHKPKPSN